MLFDNAPNHLVINSVVAMDYTVAEIYYAPHFGDTKRCGIVEAAKTIQRLADNFKFAFHSAAKPAVGAVVV